MDEKIILGIDLGVASIGWALIKASDQQPKQIIDLGVRIIPLNPDETDEFTKGNAISKNSKRTLKRTQRKGLCRYQLRRKALQKALAENDMIPNKQLMLYLSPLEIWGLRAKAVIGQISLQELGRVLLHMNQKRGYQHNKTDNSEDAKQTEYVAQVNNRYSEIRNEKKTVGQYFYEKLQQYFGVEKKTAPTFRVKENVFPRIAYKEEFDAIWKQQKQYYPTVLTDELYNRLRNEIIYYQRKLKSQKGLVGLCNFEKKKYINPLGKTIEAGPKVAPKSSPLFQVCKLWESINTITIKNRKGEYFQDINKFYNELYEYLDNNEKLTQAELFKILGIGRNDSYFTNAHINKGIQGNTTKKKLADIIGKNHPALQFNLAVENITDKTTGEVTNRLCISSDFEKQPLYRLWHYIYSLEEQDCIKKLQAEFGFDEESARRLAAIDFTKSGFGDKSAKMMRNILPYLQQGYVYSTACAMAGYNHSNSITKEENLQRDLLDKLQNLPKNSLRQPVVEKILNQLVNLVNAVIDKHGKPTEIRVELARELKQSREERNDTYLAMTKRERDNAAICKKLLEEPEYTKKTVSKRDIDRYRLWEEFGKISPYEPTKLISLTELYSGNYDIEHIIPRSLRFDNSYSNKTLCPRRYNSGENAKNKLTAYDYMERHRSEEDFTNYLEFLSKAYKEKKISKTKYENLLRREQDIKEGFIERQLRETQYIARKAKEILSQICREVYSSEGSITQHLRELWGWNEVLERINLPKFEQLGLIEEVTAIVEGKEKTFTRIKDWSKRDDHRHHAIDALAIACTRQGFIQRLNSLNAQQTRDEMYNESNPGQKDYKNKLSLLDNYLLKYKPFETHTVQQAIEGILISYKPGKKVATLSTRTIKKEGKKIPVQRGIIAPRGALSEESVYGKIKRKTVKKVKLDKNFTQVESIIDLAVKTVVKQRLEKFNNDASQAFKNLTKKPLFIDADETNPVTIVDVQVWQEEFVIKYPVSSIGEKDVPFIVDEQIRIKVQERLASFSNNVIEAYKDLENNPIWQNEEKKIPIKRVRLYTGLSADSVVPVKVWDNTWQLEYEKYLKPGNNHHIAIYRDEKGKLQEHQCTFWHAVERKKFGIPVIIKNPSVAWEDILQNRQLPDSFLEKLPSQSWQYVTSMQQNESFVFNMPKEELIAAIENKANSTIAPNVFRLRKITAGSYWFNQQFETKPKASLDDKKANRCKQASFSSMNGIKVKISNLGEIFLAE